MRGDTWSSSPSEADGEAPVDPPVLRAVNQPTLPSAGATLAVALCALFLLADGDADLVVLCEALFLSLVVVASVLDDADLTRALQVVGVVGSVVVVAVAVTVVDDVVAAVEVFPGMVALVLVVLAVFPRVGPGSRRLLKLGSGALLLSVLVSGVLRAATPDVLVLSAVGSVLVWDLGEQSICLGEHLGRRATTRRVEIAHAAGGTLVAGVALVAALTVGGLGSPDLPLHSFLLLALAVLVFAAALYD